MEIPAELRQICHFDSARVMYVHGAIVRHVCRYLLLTKSYYSSLKLMEPSLLGTNSVHFRLCIIIRMSSLFIVNDFMFGFKMTMIETDY